MPSDTVADRIHQLRNFVPDVVDFLKENPRHFCENGKQKPVPALTPHEFLSAWLIWNGIAGYSASISDLLRQLGWTPPPGA